MKILHPSCRLPCLQLHNSIFILLLILSLLLSSCRLGSFPWKSGEKNSGVILESTQYSGKIHTLIYFPDSTGSYLIPEDRIAEFDTSLEKTVMKELLRGPLSSSTVSPIPAGTKLLSISRSRDSVNVNLSGEFKRNHPGGSTAELMSIYSIVDSLTEIPGVNRVLFKIDGKLQGTLAGHVTFNKPIGRNRALLKRNKALNPAEVLNLQMTLESQGKWLEAYLLLSDDDKNPDRKFFTDYVTEMEEVKQLGFTNQKFTVGDYTIDETGAKARVRVDFYTLNPDGSKKVVNTAYFNTVKIEGIWMVDWATTQ
ncbi:MAG: GerMN protein [Clostridiales bacterium]|nr:GerMN protein [Clostridiales bacterium]